MDCHHLRNLCSCITGLSLCLGVQTVQANPGGATVVSGSASISSAGNTLTIANSPNTIIHWHDFSISAGETTQFIQQSAASAVLNRVTGGDPSLILGTLQSNGRVFLINPAGVMFGAGAMVDVAGLVASTLNISDQDFLGGRQVYNADIANPGNVTNAGEIRTPGGGFVYLIGTRVENSGVITAPSGEAILAAGHSVELVDSVDPEQRVQVSAQSQDVNLSQLMLEHDGNIFGVLNSGRISANSVTQDATGKIYFKSAGHIETTASSQVEAKGSAEFDGGYIQAFANLNGKYSGHFDASGRNGGFLETSAAYLDIGGISLNLRALDSSGHGGSWLLDPFDFLITQIEADSIEAALTDGSSVTIDTNASSFGANDDTYNGSAGLGNITFADNVSINAVGTSSDSTVFNLTANNDIIFGSGVVIDLDGGEEIDMIMTAGNDILGSGATLAAATIAMTAGNDAIANVATPVLQVIAEGDIDISALSAVDDVHISANSLGDPLLADSIQFELQANPVDTAIIDLYGESVGVTSPGDLTLTGTFLSATTGAGGLALDIAGDLDLTFALVPVGGGLFTVQTGLMLMNSSAANLQLTASNLIINGSEIDASSNCPGCNLSIDAGSLDLTGTFSGSGNSITSDKDLLIDVGTGSIALDSFLIEGSISTAGLTRIESGTLTLADSAILADIGQLTVDTGALTLTNAALFGSQLYAASTDVSASTIDLTSSFIGADTDVSITTPGALTLTDSTLSGLGTMDVSAGSATLDGISLIEGETGLTLTVAGALDMTTSKVEGGAISGNTVIQAGSLGMTGVASPSVVPSEIIGHQDLSISVSGATTLSTFSFISGGASISAGATTLSSGSLTMSGSSQIGTQRGLTVNVAGDLSITDSSAIVGNFSSTDGLATSVSAGGDMTLNNAHISSGKNLAVAAGGQLTLLNSAYLEENGSSATVAAGSLTMNNANIIAEADLGLTAGAVVMDDATIDAGGNLSMNVSSLSMSQSTVGDPSGLTPDIININSRGDVVLNDGSDIVADSEVIMRMLGRLYINSGLSGESHISTFSNNTIILYFPALFFGGYVVDGNADTIVSQFNSFTGFFTGSGLDLAAILNTNLFVFYAPASPITGIVSQNTTNTLATNPYVDSYGNYQSGPGDSSFTYGIIWDPLTGGLDFSEVRQCS